MGHKQVSDGAKKSASTPTTSSALVEVLHNGLVLDAEGRQTEMPEVLEPFEKFREAIKKHGGNALEVSAQPYIRPGRYGIRISEVRSPQHTIEIANRFHALTENLRRTWTTIVTNAQAERPQPLKALGVAEKEIAILKALGHLAKLQVEIFLTTEDGQVSEFPNATLKYLSNSECAIPETKQIKKLLTGIDMGKNKQLFVRLEQSQWVRLHFSTFDFVCKNISKGVLIVGTIEVIDGVWAMRTGDFVDAPINRELPF